MSPIENKERFAREHAQKLFPKATPAQISKITVLFKNNFVPGYSPNQNEWERGKKGTGSGATGMEYVAYLGESVIGEEPDPKILSPDQYHRARRKCLTM